MSQSDEIKQYVKTVCEQIRWKKARSIVAEEIENHICDQRDAYVSQEKMKNGYWKSNITNGQCRSVGMELDKIHRPKPQWTMIAFTGC